MNAPTDVTSKPRAILYAPTVAAIIAPIPAPTTSNAPKAPSINLIDYRLKILLNHHQKVYLLVLQSS